MSNKEINQLRMEQIEKLPAYMELENIIINYLKEKIEEDEQKREKTI